MQRYLIIIEPYAGTYSAYAPDVPGCVAAAETREELVREMGSALAFHFEGMREHGEPLPQATSTAEYVDVPEAA